MKNLENWWKNICKADKKAKRLAEKEQKRAINLKRKSNYMPKTYFGFGRNFKRCENCQLHKDAKGAITSKNYVYCTYRKVFVNKKAELMCFNVNKLQSYLNSTTGKILLC